jgi:hypothetical protein
MSGVFLPEEPGELAVAPDPDDTGRRAATTLAERASRLGWRVKLIDPPGEMDWNDAASSPESVL